MREVVSEYLGCGGAVCAQCEICVEVVTNGEGDERELDPAD